MSCSALFLWLDHAINIVAATHSFSLLGSHINRCFTTDSPELWNINTVTDIYMMPTCIHKHKCLWRMHLRADFLDHRA